MGSIPIPHYAVRVISWVILTNSWNTTADLVTGTLNTSGEARSQSVSTYSTAQLVCSWSTTADWYLKFDQEYAHTDTLSRIRITMSVTDVQQERWGLK